MEIIEANGLTFYLRPDSWDETVLTQELLLNVYDVGNPKVVVDIGAHVGGTSVLCASRGATVYAYEPSELNFGQLVLHTLENKLDDKIHPFKLAVGKGGRLYHHVNNYGCFSTDKENTTGMVDEYEEVEGISIQEVFKDIPHCDLLKIDCEGGEYEFYKDIPFEKVDQISIELHFGDNESVKELLKKHYNITETGTVLICKKC